MSMKWVAPSLVISPATDAAKAARTGRQNFAPAGSGVGIPVSSVSLSPFTVAEGAANNTVVGNLTILPSDSVVTLSDNAGGLFKLVGTAIQTTASATNYITNPAPVITLSAVWGAKTTLIPIEIDIVGAAVTDITLSAATLAHGAAQGTAIGTLASVPSGAVLTLTAGPAGKYQIVGNALQAGPTLSTAGTDSITVRAARGPQTFSKSFNITVT